MIRFFTALFMMIMLLFFSVGGVAEMLGLPWWLFGAISFVILAVTVVELLWPHTSKE